MNWFLRWLLRRYPGYAVVPREPNAWMLGAGENELIKLGVDMTAANPHDYLGALQVWRAMIKVYEYPPR